MLRTLLTWAAWGIFVWCILNAAIMVFWMHWPPIGDNLVSDPIMAYIWKAGRYELGMLSSAFFIMYLENGLRI